MPASTVSLRRVAEWVSRTLLSELKVSEDERILAERAQRQNDLGIRLSELGRREEALSATQEGVDLRLTLALRNSNAFQPDLAASLNNLGKSLSELGRKEEALKATQEAMEVYRALAQRNPDEFRPYLAMSLSNLGFGLSEVSRGEEALASIEEALDITWPFFERLPLAFMRKAEIIIKNLLRTYEALQRPLPPMVVERIEEFTRLSALNR